MPQISSSKLPNSAAPSVLIAPEVPFAAMEAALDGLGWERQPDLSALPPILPGEPEFATWRHRASDALLTYSFQPIVYLRVLSLPDGDSGARAAEIASVLDTLDSVRTAGLLRSPEEADILLGLLAVGEVRAILLYNEVKRLESHPNPRVAQAAARTLGMLREEAFALADRIELPAYAGTAQSRRQGLRRWAAGSLDPEAAMPALAAALGDPDWEVRAGAMIFAARAGATGLAGAIAQAPLPEGRIDGVHRLDARILRAIRKSAIHLLDPRIRRELRFSDPRTSHADRCVAGEPPEHIDRFFWLVTALTTPHAAPARPQHVPPQLTEQNGVYRAESIGVDFVWIPPVPHWAGGPAPDGPEASLTLELSPGMFFARTASEETYAIEEVDARLGQLREASGLALQVPTTGWREMAVWGTDARLFPWGNGAEPLEPPWTGPWGVLIGEVPEWALNRTSSALERWGGPVRCHSCAVPASPPEAALRLALAP
jgi:hypothetical protein